MTVRKRVGILISGRGSNMEALVRAASAADYPASVALVISDRGDAAGLTKASTAGIPTAVVATAPDRGAREAAINEALESARVELVCLAGFMRLLSAAFVERWRDRLMNIHPSLLPAFPGLATHSRALAAGVRTHGCSVHFVRAEVDAGPIIAQATVPVRAGDTETALAGRVLAAEHRLYPHALALVAAGRVRVVDEKVLIDGKAGPFVFPDSAPS